MPHITLLYDHLYKLGWIDGLEAAFRDLFSGERSRRWLTWTSGYGKSTLAELFKQLVAAEKVVVPAGYTRAAILQGHFKDRDGAPLTGLDKGNGPNSRALPDIKEAIKLMNTSLTSAYDDYKQGSYDYVNDDDDYAREFSRQSDKQKKGWHYIKTP